MSLVLLIEICTSLNEIRTSLNEQLQSNENQSGIFEINDLRIGLKILYRILKSFISNIPD